MSEISHELLHAAGVIDHASLSGDEFVDLVERFESLSILDKGRIMVAAAERMHVNGELDVDDLVFDEIGHSVVQIAILKELDEQRSGSERLQTT